MSNFDYALDIMPKIRDFKSLEKSVRDVIDKVGVQDCLMAIEEFTGQKKTDSMLYKWSDPDTDQNIQFRYALALDIACIRKGLEPILLSAHKDMLSDEDATIHQNRYDLVSELLKINAELGNLNKTAEEARDPKSEQGDKLSNRELNEIKDVISNIENRIKDLKLSLK